MSVSGELSLSVRGSVDSSMMDQDEVCTLQLGYRGDNTPSGHTEGGAVTLLHSSRQNKGDLIGNLEASDSLGQHFEQQKEVV